MALLDPVAQSMDGLLVVEIDRDFHLVNRVDARNAQWTGNGWRLSNGFVRAIDGVNRVRSESFDFRTGIVTEHIDDFTQVQKSPSAMSFLELQAFVSKLRQSGHEFSKYLVKLYSKLSFPLVHFIVVLVAIPFALVSPRSGGRAVGIGVAIAIAAAYWMVDSIAVALAEADLLPAILGAWTANIVFAGIGAALFFNART